MSVRELARPEIQGLAPYGAAEQVDDTIRLNANEAPWRSSGDTFRRPLNRYPEVRPARLRQQLADYYGCGADRLLVTRGSSEAIDLLFRVFCVAGRDNVVTAVPTFSMYGHYATIQGVTLRKVVTRAADDFAIDDAAILEACDERTRIVFLCSPNNPTGTLVPRRVLVEILTQRRGRSVVVVDEAYIEFAGQASAVELIDEYDNLVVLRTLSKGLALAGARCGAAIATPAAVNMLNAVQAPYALATPVIDCVEDAMSAARLDQARSEVAATIEQREMLRAALERFPWTLRVYPSAANFLLVQVADAQGLMTYTAKEKVLLRHFGNDLADCVRISVGSRSENERLLDTLARMESSDD
jgi:histidinol-phosphate aminotransferase